ncbi:ATP-binding cassette sub-family G member 1 isoform X2 [Cryptotermes secundus]|uniref:ATP-binding cassette sub-family G member 1 isoform X2 n=1 Tax=Cryptotermes secundus TaxID=105785 RepID=UPI000CD7DEA1|nr:ATP-binding cassette sub-family G member 1 isoform X2 [Cryptotermes secundus]
MENQTKFRRSQEIKKCHHHKNIGFRNLCYSVQENKARQEQPKVILRGVNGEFRSGRLTAILGPSGAGKSSLLNVLSGFKSSGVTGYITVNGVERNTEEFRRESCYITQNCYLMDLLTTRETLAVAASFKLNAKVTTREKNDMINDILELLGLRKAAETRVGKLSGGEKKRLSIGQELLTNPPVMFFDEPTSGLDSSSSLQVISHLKSLVRGGRTIVCSIHQPSSRLFEMFDDLYVLAEGQCLYSGAISDMTAVFQESGFKCPKYYNRADFAVEVACRERGMNIEKLIAKAETHFHGPDTGRADYITNEETSMLRPSIKKNSTDTYIQVPQETMGSRYPVTLARQISVLLKRAVLCTIRDLHLAQLRLVSHVVIGLFLGGVFYGIGDEASKVASNTAFLMFSMMFLFFCNLFPFVHSFPLEKLVVMREHMNNWYSLEAYHISKIVAELPLQILCPTGFLVSAYFLTGQPTEATRFFQFWAVFIMVAAIAQSLGLATGAAVEPQLGVFVVSTIALPMLIFSGFYLRLQDMQVFLQWLSYVAYFRYAFEALMQSVYGYDRPYLKCSEAYCHFKSPRKYLEEFDMEDANYWTDMLGLLVWIAALQIVFHLMLKFKMRVSR